MILRGAAVGISLSDRRACNWRLLECWDWPSHRAHETQPISPRWRWNDRDMDDVSFSASRTFWPLTIHGHADRWTSFAPWVFLLVFCNNQSSFWGRYMEETDGQTPVSLNVPTLTAGHNNNWTRMPVKRTVVRWRQVSRRLDTWNSDILPVPAVMNAPSIVTAVA